MSSKQFVLAWALAHRGQETSIDEIRARLKFVDAHVAGLSARRRVRIEHCGPATGLVAWKEEGQPCSWDHFPQDANEAVGATWIHVPGCAGPRDSGTDSLRLAEEFVHGRDVMDIGVPAALIYYSRGNLTVLNDSFGMVRLYQFEFSGFGTVWSTRQGLAHIFAGVAPVVSDTTWAGMATLGWTTLGDTHLGDGHQLRPRTRISVSKTGEIRVRSDHGEWIQHWLANSPPDAANIAKGMTSVLQPASWWPVSPAADLSGGKDSRVTAASAIRAGIVNAVRAIDNDKGEVETAQQLMSLIPESGITHEVVQPSQPTVPDGQAYERFLLLQRFWEGAFLSRSAYRSSLVTKLKDASSVRINGLGGEAMQGKTLLTPRWIEKMDSARPAGGSARLAVMLRSSIASSGYAREATEAQVKKLIDEAVDLDISTSYGAVDYFYNYSKMPYWSIPQGSENVLTPYYCAALQPQIISSMRRPAEYGEMHRALLRALIPSWADVPFYKPSAKTRSFTWMWENDDWAELRGRIEEARHSLINFNSESIGRMMDDVADGTAAVAHELGFTRIIWELSCRDYAKEVGRAAGDVSDEIKRMRQIL